MNPEAQRIAMAELCGWISQPDEYYLDKLAWRHPNKDLTWATCDLPDYLNDRNATWAAAEQLGEATIKAMRFWLFTICGEMKAHHATAAQETEAILRFHGKWVEEKTELMTGRT